MNARAPTADPVAAQQLVARYVALVEEHAAASAFPAAVSTLPASKTAIKDAVRTVHDALVATGQRTPELTAFLEDAFVALSNYVDDELATLAAEHRRASVALETTSRQPGERLQSPNWEVVARTSRLAGEIARTSAVEAEDLRREFQRLTAVSERPGGTNETGGDEAFPRR